MTSILTCVATSTAWCFCTASASLLTSCCGNDKASSIPPGPNSGRKRSVALLMLGIGLSLVFQYGLSKIMLDDRIPDRIFLKGYWLDNCVARFGGNDEAVEADNNDAASSSALVQSCVRLQANYRVGCATTLFFLLAALASCCKRTANREAWPAKLTLYLFLVVATIFLPADPILTDIYLNVARAGGALFILFQSMVIVDVAHNWNESWVEKSNAAERDDKVGAGQKWLYAILVSCATLFAVSIGLFIYTIVQYHGCPLNDIIMAATFLLICAVTAAQLSGEEGSLLGSACMAAWATYLCHAAVTKNPATNCHANTDAISIFSIILGVAVTIISILWTGWSYTAADKLRNNNQDHDDDNDDHHAAPSSAANKPEQTTTTTTVGGIVTGTNNNDDDVEGGGESQPPPSRSSSSSENVTWRLNLALAVIAGWASMILTHWGQVQQGVQQADADNDGNDIIIDPGVGRVSVWMIVVSQWLALSLYLWTLLAPRLFPNRDFS